MKLTTKIALAVAVFVLLVPKKAKASSLAKINDNTLKNIYPGLKVSYANALVPAMADGNINTPLRVSAFLAQILHETGGFKYMQEIASGQAYEGRKDLGNNQPGDGTKFKGRGFIQLTGRANYKQAGQELGLDLENNPDLAAQPTVAAKTAVWFWNRKNLNAKADVEDIVGITRAINGGTKGLENRKELYAKAKAVFLAPSELV